MNMTTKKLSIGGMTCQNCQSKIEKALLGTKGVKKASVSFGAGTAEVTYDSDTLSLGAVIDAIEGAGYDVLVGSGPQKQGWSRAAGLLIIIAALYMLLEWFGVLNLLTPGRLAETNMGYGMLLVIGLATSVHCIAMCGGISLSQCIPKSAGSGPEDRLAVFRPAFLYNLGRVISYTGVGFVVGALGSVITFSNMAQGILKLIAGIFMLVMGLNMLELFPALRKLVPRMPKAFAHKINKGKSSSSSPLIVGLLNGFMPCGPLQAMQIYALSTGSPVTGALSMLLFSLGTVPLMFGLGAVSSMLGRKFTKKVMAIGAILVVVLGLSMLSQGLSLSGFSGPSAAGNASGDSGVIAEDGVQAVNSTLAPGKYPAITVQAGTPVKWTINAPEGSINGCNNRMIVNKYGIEHKFEYGDNIIEFTPSETGVFQYSCWMGMIRSTITVVEAGVEIEQTLDLTAPVPANVMIPTDRLAVAELASENGREYQTVAIELADDGFSPAVVVVQAGLDTEWIISVTCTDSAGLTLRVPVYNTELNLEPGENPIDLSPAESFDFSSGSNKFFGYVKVVDNLALIDEAAVREEVQSFKPMIWPEDTFYTPGRQCCCG